MEKIIICVHILTLHLSFFFYSFSLSLCLSLHILHIHVALNMRFFNPASNLVVSRYGPLRPRELLICQTRYKLR